MIELAPRHKVGLSLTNPVLIASGCGGYGNSYQRLIDLTAFGAIVTNPITLRPRRGVSQPRLAETLAGLILNTGDQNPGVRKVIQHYGKSWLRLGLPIIAHLPADEPDDLLRTARALFRSGDRRGSQAIAAIELGISPEATPSDVERWLRAVAEGCELPILAKMPLEGAANLAEAAHTFADALVIGSSPLGTARLADEMVHGPLYGPALHNLVLNRLQTLKDWVDLPLIAAGGIHTLADVHAFLEAGAVAVQIDTLLFIEPKMAENIAKSFDF